MPRAPRILVEGGLYHVYNRFARGEGVFSDPQEAIEFVELFRDLKQRDGLQVLAWSLLSNHYHLALRTSAVPLSRTMRTLQGTFSRAFNRRWKRTGPLWQSRYQTRLVDSQRYYEQLVFYIHLNPVRAGLTDDPANYVFGGHRELLGKVHDPIIDVDDALVAFGNTTKVARRSYLKRLTAALADEDRPGVSERLPWWTAERELRPSLGRAYVDELGRSTGRERKSMEADGFIKSVGACLGVSVEVIASSRKDPETNRLHQLVATVGIERWNQKAGKLGAVLGRHPDVVSRWVRTGADRKLKDVEFSQAVEELDRLLTEASDIRDHVC
jgi:REP element-mobilizing transposase RayT